MARSGDTPLTLVAVAEQVLTKRAFPNHLLERKRRLSEKLCRAE